MWNEQMISDSASGRKQCAKCFAWYDSRIDDSDDAISPRLAAAVVVARIQSADAGLDINQAEGGQGRCAEPMRASRRRRNVRRVPIRRRRSVLSTWPTPLTEDVALWLLKEERRGRTQGSASLCRPRDGDGDPRTLPRDQAWTWTRNGLRASSMTSTGSTPFSDEDLAAIETRMAEVVARDEKFLREH